MTYLGTVINIVKSDLSSMVTVQLDNGDKTTIEHKNYDWSVYCGDKVSVNLPKNDKEKGKIVSVSNPKEAGGTVVK